MSEAPERVEAVTRLFVVDDEGVFRHGTCGAREGDTVLVTGGLYQRALSRYDEAVRQRDAAVEALGQTEAWIGMRMAHMETRTMESLRDDVVRPALAATEGAPNAEG